MLSAFLALIDSESDKHKFEQIYHKYLDTIYNVAIKQVNDYHLAQDAIQEALLRIAKVIDKFDDVDSESTKGLICTIAKYASIYIYNKSNPDNFESVESQKQATVFYDDYSADYIYEALQRLDERYSSVLMLKIKYELADKDIAEIVHLPYTTVRSRIQRGRILFGKMIEKL